MVILVVFGEVAIIRELSARVLFLWETIPVSVESSIMSHERRNSKSSYGIVLTVGLAGM